MSKKVQRQPSLTESLIPIVFLIFLLSMNVMFWDDTLRGANQVALMTAAALSGILGLRMGYTWTEMREKIVKTIGTAMPAILILLLIGALAGTWLISGVIPALIYYGLDILKPKIFLFAAVLIGMIVSTATGSSWSTIATIGVATLGIGDAMGFDKAVVAGAIVSGAYFGDKMSPLSDTTNLAPAVSGTDIFTHIRYMMYTTIPSITITLIIFLIMGFNLHGGKPPEHIAEVQASILQTFHITPWLFLVPVILFIVIIKKMPPLPALAIGVLLGGIFAVIFQPHIIQNLTHITDNYAKASYIGVMQAIYGPTHIVTPNKEMNDLFSTGGMEGMLDTIWLILSAMIFGGIMESNGMLRKITRSILKLVKSDGTLITSTAVSCIFFNITASDQYISIVVPGEMYHDAFKDRGLKPEVLSRTLEDAGTVTSVLIPWNTGGATQARVLGVPTLSYLPYAFFNLISPLMTIFFAYMNIKIRRYKDDKENKRTASEAGNQPS
ncbi:Na+/H+ antiporter NhaC [Candidatus Sulfidibacterium hydrothermale]|uniref:Na+/H+ antiporter NhaC n=1 Tax=Candidatus Sulfidibacterium hydrothermale TaxID=2875962 RepID=UPI0037440C0D